ncbi:hypothetical protein TD95_001241 [Thielaviopsis punctulata]|uniref:4a-hydroxytetrahydrobiopterin dehydratase n=1 Tax=Thielaviopsis punctulata TaxID=72032 RepID=A0A0F4ZAX8_9PEZI|nr:hypothetical protein TD95_001241 [Thielaviopsis punctulata]
MSNTPVYAAGEDAAALQPQVDRLLAESSWGLAAQGEALERAFKFKTFAKTWVPLTPPDGIDFMTAVSLQCKLKSHHPEWSNVYNTTFIRWTTHNPRGLTAKDVALAQICDALAKDFGEVPPEPAVCNLKNLAGHAAQTAGEECCTPKTKKA